MKALVIAVALLVFLASPALAGQCPLLIKQLNEAVAKMKADDPNVIKAKPMIAQAQKLHEGTGNHAEAIKTAEEAAKVLGIKLQMKK